MLASIWLRLGKEQEASLGTLIQRLASSHGTVPFQPHLTVCSSQSEVAWDAAAEYVRSSKALPLRVGKKRISFSTTAPMRAVVIDVEDTPGSADLSKRFAADNRRGRAPAAAHQPPLRGERNRPAAKLVVGREHPEEHRRGMRRGDSMSANLFSTIRSSSRPMASGRTSGAGGWCGQLVANRSCTPSLSSPGLTR